MKVGWIGLGKLGLPCALVLGDSGHEVVGYDVDTRVKRYVTGERDALPWVEPGVIDLLERSKFEVADSVGAVVQRADVIFCAVQTPHAPQFGGEMPVPDETRDFEYGYLVQAVREVASAALNQHKYVTVVVVSTVLPGTTRRLLLPQLSDFVSLVYSPQFIAMGTTIYDFTHPEFLLLGSDDSDAVGEVVEVFDEVHGASVIPTTIESAELIKVAYNTFISMKIVWANHLAQICTGVGADSDAVVDALALATDRVISPAYLRAGMGDGGACHPRDLIALNHLERQLGVTPFFGGLAHLRDEQTRDLAKLVKRWVEQTGLPYIILGKAYKPGVSLTAGSPALLLRHVLMHELNLTGSQWDPHVDGKFQLKICPAVFVIATRHSEFEAYDFPPGSVVIDPFGYVSVKSGVTLVRPGRH